ncbi:haloacid dehalogenase type II [Acuticoccus sediminis]|nr:haloacid dehalogenase type II [Acuticoccus sediminis]
MTDNEMIMPAIDVVFFDVLGTVVDWRGSITGEVANFLRRHEAHHIDAGAFADAWVGRYDAAAGAVRDDGRPYVTLDVLNRETLDVSLSEVGIAPSGLPARELDELTRAWHRLKPWPDAVAGIAALKKRFIVAPLSDGHTRMLVDMAKFAGLPWDVVLGADLFQAYKPMPQVYSSACGFLDVAPERAMLVAAHGYDLAGARACGLKTAFIQRSNASDPSKACENQSRHDWDFSADDLCDLARRL